MEGIAPAPPGVYTKFFKTQGLAGGYREDICVEKGVWGRLRGALEGEFVKFYQVQAAMPGCNLGSGDRIRGI